MESIESNLRNLPDEVWMMILENLEESDLLNATLKLVCKKWNNLILNTAKIMNNLVLIIMIEPEEFLKPEDRPKYLNEGNIENFKIIRKYKNVSMKFIKDWELEKIYRYI